MVIPSKSAYCRCTKDHSFIFIFQLLLVVHKIVLYLRYFYGTVIVDYFLFLMANIILVLITNYTLQKRGLSVKGSVQLGLLTISTQPGTV